MLILRSSSWLFCAPLSAHAPIIIIIVVLVAAPVPVSQASQELLLLRLLLLVVQASRGGPGGHSHDVLHVLRRLRWAAIGRARGLAGVHHVAAAAVAAIVVVVVALLVVVVGPRLLDQVAESVVRLHRIACE